MHKRYPVLILLFASIVFLSIANVQAKPITDPIRIDSGLISGFTWGEKKDVLIYEGVPFAKPPVGDLRWKPPQPPDPWDGVLETKKPCAWCPQPESIAFKRRTGPQSEDCLYLNVWTTAKDTNDKNPVMVWIHGGGSTTGSGGSLIYSGARLAQMGAVVVTINYRLGPLGYMAHPLLSKESKNNVSGNYGFLDQIEALKWVQRNIAAFGGDPGNITIFGESAGASAVTRLMVSPLAKGLFHRAISQSGGPFGRNRHLREKRLTMDAAESVGEEIAKRLGCDKAEDVLAAMRAKSPEELIRVSKPVQGLFGEGIKFGPIVDGLVLPKDPGLLWIEGKMVDVPFMVGANADEGTIFLKQSTIDTVRKYTDTVNRLYGERAGDILKQFPVTTDDHLKPALNKLIAVSAFISPARTMARLATGRKSAVYLYHFTRVAPLPRLKRLGAFHAAEIFYAFGNLGPVLSNEEIDHDLSEKMKAYWTNFAKNGNPNGPGLPAWPVYKKENDRHMELGAEIRTGQGLYREACDIFEQLLYERITKK